MPPLDLSRLHVHPLSARRSLTRVEEILIDPDSPPPECSPQVAARAEQAAADIRAARERGSAVMLIYGAHLLRNGAARIVERLMAEGWLTHLATNGAGTIHDWEYAWHGESSESVEMNVADGTFGAWHETAWHIHVALMAGALEDEGYGRALGRLIWEDGVELPTVDELVTALAGQPRHRLAAARADLLRVDRAARAAHRPDRSAASLERRVDPGPGLSPWRADHRTSGHRLRHHLESSDVQRRGDRASGRDRFSLVRRQRGAARRRRGALHRFGDHGSAGLREDA